MPTPTCQHSPRSRMTSPMAFFDYSKYSVDYSNSSQAHRGRWTPALSTAAQRGENAMSRENRGQFLGSPRARHKLRAAAALGAVSIFGAVCIPSAAAAPSASPATSVSSTPAAEVNSDADIAALQQLKATYFTDVDAKDWAGLRTLFAPDAVVDTRSSFGPIFYGRDPFIAF